MSTRGLTGFRHGGQEWLAYNHSDSYPTYLDKQVVETLAQLDVERAKRYLDSVKKVNSQDKPTDGLLKRLWPHTKDCGTLADELARPRKHRADYYRLLRAIQGAPMTFVNNSVPVWLDDDGFQYDGSCEWGYVFNLDDASFEVYTSHWFATSGSEAYYPVMKPRGRYATSDKVETGERPLNLLGVITFADFKELPRWAVLQWMDRLERRH